VSWIWGMFNKVCLLIFSNNLEGDTYALEGPIN